MTWGALGEYIFKYNGTDNTVGGGVNSLMAIAGNINISQLTSSSTQFTLDLVPTTLTSTTTPVTYTIATIGGNINGGTVGSDITSKFNIIGSYSSASTPTVTLGTDPANSALKAVLLTFTPTSAPEPTSLTFIGVVAAAALRRRSRRV
jgi:hypothetical protein